MNLPQMIKDLEQGQKQYAPYIIPEYRGFITFRPEERHPGNPEKYAELENQIKQLHKTDSYKTTNNYQQLKAAYQDTLKDKDKSLQEFTKEQKAIDAEIQKITQNQKKASL